MLKKLCISLGLIFSVFSMSMVAAQQDGYWQPNGYWQQSLEQQRRMEEEQRLNQERQQWEENNRNAANKATSNAADPQGGFASAPRVTIVNKYGAVAWNNHGGFDSAFGKGSREEAEQEALSKCGSDCYIRYTYWNQCAALAWGAQSKGKFFSVFESGRNRELAERKALSLCTAKAHDCQVSFSECSL